MRPARCRIEMVHVIGKLPPLRLDPDRAAQPGALVGETLVQPWHALDPVGEHPVQLVVAGNRTRAHRDRPDRYRRAVPLHLQPEGIDGMQTVRSLGHGAMLPL